MPRPDRPGFNPSNPAVFKENLNAFERLLAHNRKARIIWAHADTDPLLTRTPELQRELLARHPNLYMSLRPGPGGPHPVFVLDPTFKSRWRSPPLYEVARELSRDGCDMNVALLIQEIRKENE